MKLLLWAAIIFLVIWVVRSKKHASEKSFSAHSSKSPAADGNSEAMLTCAQCGAYFPASEAVSGPSGLIFCSDEHRRLHAR